MALHVWAGRRRVGYRRLGFSLGRLAPHPAALHQREALLEAYEPQVAVALQRLDRLKAVSCHPQFRRLYCDPGPEWWSGHSVGAEFRRVCFLEAGHVRVAAVMDGKIAPASSLVRLQD